MAWKRTKEEVAVTQTPTASKEVVKVEEQIETVVTELPSVPIRKIRGEDGAIHNLTTLTEAVQEIREGLRELLKRTAD